MTKKLRDPVKEKQEWLTYALFYFFMASFVLKTVVGLLSGSKFLLVSGVFALFGVFIAVVSLIHIGAAYPAPRHAEYFNRGKLEFIIILGVSVTIALSTVFLLFSVSHMLFFHALYPAGISAAWMGIFCAGLNFCLMAWANRQFNGARPGDEQKLISFLAGDLILSLLAAVNVVISRIGWYLFDYACAIILAAGIIVYSVSFFFSAFKGLMDASCDKKTMASIEEMIRQAQGRTVLRKLRVQKCGDIFEIIAVLAVPAEMPVFEIEKAFKNIRYYLGKEFAKPHEIFAGIS